MFTIAPMTAIPSFSRARRAFTLVELLVVIVILGILMAVAVPTFLRQQAKAQDSRTQQYLATAFKAIRAGLPDTGQQYPISTSMVSWITQSEPELLSASGSCTTAVQTALQDKILVDPASTSTSLTLCARSQSGNVWKLTASNTGVQSLLNGTLVPLTESAGVVNDANRSSQGDGLSSDSSTGIWVGTTNLNPNGGFESGMTGWSYQYVANGNAVASTDRAKFGSQSLKITRTAAGSEANVWENLTLAPSTTYTYSAWVWAPNVGDAAIWTYNGSVNMSTAQNTVANQWQRLSGTFTTTAAGTIQLRLGHPVGDSDLTSVYFDGVQVETSAFPTPYVETNGSTASRANARVQSPSSVINQTQSWIAARVRVDRPLSNALGSNWPRLFAWGYNNEGNPRNSIDVYYDGPSGSWGIGAFNSGTGSSIGGSTNQYTYTGNGSEYVTVIGYWTATQLGISAAGGTFLTTARTGGVPAAAFDSLFDIGNLVSGQQFDGDFLWFATGTGTLANADAATINGFGNTDPKVSQFPAAAQATMVWDGAGTNGSLK